MLTTAAYTSTANGSAATNQLPSATANRTGRIHVAAVAHTTDAVRCTSTNAPTWMAMNRHWTGRESGLCSEIRRGNRRASRAITGVHAAQTYQPDAPPRNARQSAIGRPSERENIIVSNVVSSAGTVHAAMTAHAETGCT